MPPLSSRLKYALLGTGLLAVLSLGLWCFTTDSHELPSSPVVQVQNLLAQTTSSKNTGSHKYRPPMFVSRIIDPDYDQVATEATDRNVPLYGTLEFAWALLDAGSNYEDNCEVRSYYVSPGREVINHGGGGQAGGVEYKVMKTGNRFFKLYCKLKGSNYYGTVGNTLGYKVAGCEYPFHSAVNDMNSGKMIGSGGWMRGITENSFRDWASSDSFDHCGFNGEKCTIPPPTYDFTVDPRGGDKGDIEVAMSANHLCLSNTGYSWPPTGVSPNAGQMALDHLYGNVSNGYPWPLILHPMDYNASSHSIIVLEVDKIERVAGDSRETIYYIDYLDSNGPTIDEMTCQNQAASGTDSEGESHNFNAFVCSNSSEDSYLEGILLYPTLGLDVSALANKYRSYCISYPQSNFCKSREPSPAEWLRNNYPNIDNPSGQNDIGTCFGWSDFVLKVTYLGDFVGECPRP